VLIFYQLTVYRNIDGDLLRLAAEFNEVPRRIHRIFPQKTVVRTRRQQQCFTIWQVAAD